MNKGILITGALGACALVASAAQASDGTITINGAIATQTCTINGAAGGNFTVTLPTVQSTAFSAAGATAGRTGFNIELTNCAPATGNVTAFFEQGPTINTATGYLNNTLTGAGNATNVQVQLLNATGTIPFVLTQPRQNQGAAAVAISAAGTATLAYAAQYVAVGGIPTPGAVATTVVYSLDYN